MMRKFEHVNGHIEGGSGAPPLVAGDTLTRAEFMRRWENHPEIKRAELIGGVVYMPSPVSMPHGDTEADVGGLLFMYASNTPGTKTGHNMTTFMLEEAPQPDVNLRILPEYGGSTSRKGLYLSGPPELISEVCVSSASFDLHQKLELYQEAGVREYLAILMMEQEIRWHRLTKNGYRLLKPTGGVWKSKVFPGLWLDGAALLANDSAKLVATLRLGLDSPEHANFVKKLGRKKAK